MRYAVLTADVETDWGGRNSVEGMNKGIEEEIPRLLDFLRKQKIKGTFFVSANLLPKYRKQILEMKKEKHEIACHGMFHRDMSKLSKNDFVSEIKACRDVFRKEKIGLKGFRAPQFRIRKEQIKELGELGFDYDSSMLKSFFPGRYSNLSMKKGVFRVNGKIAEIPVSSSDLLHIPFGLLWANNLGMGLFRSLIRHSDKPVVFYFHPFDLVSVKGDFDVGFPVKAWYKMKVKRVYDTLGKVVKEFRRNGYSFLRCEELAGKFL